MASQALTDLMQSGFSDTCIKFYFITKSGTADDASKDLIHSFQIIAEFLASTDHLQWISEADCVLLPADTLTRQNIFVLDEFEGQAFEYVSTTKAIVLGPKCVLRSQLTNDVVPNNASPIFTLAMKNVVVCVSGILKRSEIHKLVGFMGGLWLKELTESATHLITNTVQSCKYEKAAMRNMKIMKEEWIHEVWRLSKMDDTSYTTDEFYEKYKLPIFYNLVVTSTGISEAAKTEMVKLIENNGGTYSGSFKSKNTDILISQPNQRNSDKFKAAVKCRKECLMVDWVTDSVLKGYALPYVNYRIYTGQATSGKLLNSTQKSNQSINQFNPDATQLSCIMNDYSIAESTVYRTTPTKRGTLKCVENNYKETLDKMDISLVKTVEGCLDGCTIWLCGFDANYMDKLKKIINIGGAIRIDEYGPNVEYVIVGKPNSSELCTLKSLENSNIVTVDWLVTSINSKKIADPKEFIYKLEMSNSDSTQTVPSPASRKNIEAMNPFRRPAAVTRRLNLNEGEDNIEIRNEKTLLEQYAKPSTSQANIHQEESEADATEDQIDPNLFKNLIFALFGFSEESTMELQSEIEECGGIVVEEGDFSKIVDYLVVTGDVYNLDEVQYKAKEIVTELWIQECFTINKLVDIKYYHRALLLKKDVQPLQGLNIVFSTYTSSERDYYYCMARALGGNVNDRYIRNERPILICPTPDGKKYIGAIKWNLPVVSSEWLKKCYELEEKVSLRKYLVGEAKCIENEENSNDQNSESSQNSNSGASDKEAHTQKFEKSTKLAENTSSNRKDNDVREAIPEQNIDAYITPVKHPRLSLIKQSVSRQVSPQSSCTPPGQKKTPLSKFVEDLTDLTPETRKVVYAICKSNEEKETPLTKRRRVVTNSPVDMSCLDRPDFFEIRDRHFVEIPKAPSSESFKDYRKRMYKNGLGDKFDGTSLRNPYDIEVEQKTIEPSRDGDEKTGENECQVEDVETTPEESTQVKLFRKSIQKCREKFVYMPPNTEELIEKHSGAHNDPPEEEQPIQPSQPGVVDWRDPDDFFRSDRFLDGSRSTFKGKRCFSMSLTVEVEPQTLKDQILTLGGTVCEDSSEFNPSCTHLICSKPNQSEKTLSIVASGRWLLCPSYIVDSFKANRFLNEEDYEWGNPKAESKLPITNDPKANKIAMVSYKRRKELQLRSNQENKPVGVFSGFRVILHANRKDSFKRLIEAGCGVVVDLKEPYSEQENFRGVTHCFVDKRMKQMSDADKAALHKTGVHCVNYIYLQACLQEDSLPNVKDFLV